MYTWADFTEDFLFYYEDYFVVYHVYIFSILLFLIFMISFCCLIRKQYIRKKKMKSLRRETKNLRTNVFSCDLQTWKNSLEMLHKENALLMSEDKCRFISLRVFFTICVIWGIYELALIPDFFSEYIYYMQYIYLVILPFEYLFSFYSLSYSLIRNYNLVSDQNTCLLIAFGGSKLKDKLETMDEVLSAACQVFPSKSIFLLHNGNSHKPEFYDPIQVLVKKHNINYMYLPIGNKTYSIYIAAKDFVQHKFKQALLIDDDVILPKNIHIKTLPKNVACVAYPICASLGNSDSSWQKLLSSFQNLEYVKSTLWKKTQEDWHPDSSSMSHHGAIGMWRIKDLIDVLADHDSIFHGEDLEMGLDALKKKKKMKMVFNEFVETAPPRKIFGEGGLYRQRIQSWDFVVVKFIPEYFKILFFSDISTNLILKFVVLHELWTIFIDFQRLPIIGYVLYVHNIEYAYFFAAIYALNVVMAMWCNYVIIPSKKRSTFLSVITYPIYSNLLLIFRLMGELRYIYLYNGIRFRCPVHIDALPELPHILESTEWTYEMFENGEINWDQIWCDDQYLRKSMKLKPEVAEKLGQAILRQQKKEKK